MEKIETKFWILLDSFWYGQWFTNASITTSLCWVRCTWYFNAFRRRWYNTQTCNQNTEIRDQFIDKSSSNRLRRRLLQEPNLILEIVIKKAQAMELAKKQFIIMQPDEMQAGMATLKVTQVRFSFQ